MRGWAQLSYEAQLSLRIMCMISMPAMVIAADQKLLKPSIGLVICLIAQWSCSAMLLSYLTWRISILASYSVV